MIKLTPNHLPLIQEQLPYITWSSLISLTSRFGLSNSEWNALLSTPNHSYYVAPTLDFLVELTRVDIKYAALSFSLHGVPVENVFGTWLQDAMKKTGCSKAYCYLFDWETREAKGLERLGFEREAVFREHIYTRDGYQNLLVYGLLGDLR